MTTHDEQSKTEQATHEDALELETEAVKDLEAPTDAADAVRGGPCTKSWGV